MNLIFKGLIVLFLAGISYRTIADVTMDEFASLLDSKQAVTVIDIRPNSSYQLGHVKNAINIPSSLIKHKRLPPLGRVIVYGDGIDFISVDVAVEELNGKAGINAEALVGGYSTWVARGDGGASFSVTAQQALSVTYEKTKQLLLKNSQVVLVNLMKRENRTLLKSEFPTANVIELDISREDELVRDLFSQLPSVNSKVIILIDDGDGLASRLARIIHASGYIRVGVLDGGVLALESKGQIKTSVHKSGG